MILFKPKHVPLILSGRKTETRRTWKIARVKVGKTYQAKTQLFGEPFARLLITGLRRERLGNISEESIHAEGYDSIKGFMEAWMEIKGSWNPNLEVWVVKYKLEEREK